MTTMSKPKPWNRLLWGVEFSSPRAKPMLLGSVWLDPMPKSQYTGEPSRALLFTTRKAAREWCSNKMASYAERPETTAWRWRFRPVRVREIVRVVNDNP